MPVFEPTPYETIDFLLRRDWFLDDDGILDLLWTADQAAYDRLVENRKTYSARIRRILGPLDHLPDISRLKLRVAVVPSLSPTLAQQSCDASRSSSPTHGHS